MKLGLHLLTYGATWPEVMETVRLVDRLGYDYLFGADHLLATGGDPSQPFFEGWTSLAAWGQATERVRLGLLVGANPFRPPAVVAKMVVTLDHLTGGRVILGLGAAWMESEMRGHGIDAGSGLGERIDWLDEALTVIAPLTRGEIVRHDGPRYRIDGLRHAPAGLQQRIPVLIGATGERKGLRLAARHADLWQTWVAADSVDAWRRKDDVLREHCRIEGRDGSRIERLVGGKIVIRDRPEDALADFEARMTVHGWPDAVREHAWLGRVDDVTAIVDRYREAGADTIVAQAAVPFDHETIERLAQEVIGR